MITWLQLKLLSDHTVDSNFNDSRVSAEVVVEFQAVRSVVHAVGIADREDGVPFADIHLELVAVVTSLSPRIHFTDGFGNPVNGILITTSSPFSKMAVSWNRGGTRKWGGPTAASLYYWNNGYNTSKSHHWKPSPTDICKSISKQESCAIKSKDDRPRDARYISRSWAVVRYGHSKLSKMAAAAILDLFEPDIAPLDPPSPKTPP